MEDLSVLLDGVQQAEAGARATAKQAKDDAAATLDTLQRSIDLGLETTGDRLRDGVIVLYGGWLATGPEILKNYEETAENLKGKAGEPVVIVHRWTQREGCSGFGRRDNSYRVLRTDTSVGVLEGDELVFDYDEKTCALPTSRYACQGSKHRDEVRVHEGNLTIGRADLPFSLDWYNWFDLGALHQTIDPGELEEARLPFYRGGSMDALTVAIGNAGITEWLAGGEEAFGHTTAEFGTARRLCDELGIPRLDPVTDEQKRYLGIR